MSLDLFSDDWASIPIENPLPAPKAESFIMSALGVPPALLNGPVILTPRVILPDPVIAEIPDQPVEPAEGLNFQPEADASADDTHVLAFVSQAWYFGHRDPSLEPVSVNSAGRRFFDTQAVTRFANTLIHRDDDDEMTPDCWRLAIEAARRTGRKGARRC